jgi:hypothetical protein
MIPDSGTMGGEAGRQYHFVHLIIIYYYDQQQTTG